MVKPLIEANDLSFFDKIFEVFMSLEGEEAYQARGLQGFAEFLGVKRGKVYAWKGGRFPAAEDLAILHKKLGISCEWLITQKGSMQECAWKGGVPAITFVASRVLGWSKQFLQSQKIPFPDFNDDLFAVVASGDTMYPAGIRNGMVLFCDSSRQPEQGEPVYVELVDGLAAIRVFLGKGIAGVHEATKGCIAFQSWTGGDENQPFYADVPETQIKRIVRIAMVSFSI